MKVVKILGIFLAVVALLITGSLAFVIANFDAPRLKAEAIRAVQDATGRKLSIDGDLQLSFWPSPGLRVGKVTLYEFGSDQVFATLDEGKAAVALWPLLSRQLHLKTLRLNGLQATFVRRANGSLNIDDLIHPKAAAEAEKKPHVSEPVTTSEPPLAVDVAGIKVSDANFNWHDEVSGEKASIAGLQLSTGPIQVDVGQQHYALSDLALSLKGLRDSEDGEERFEVKFATPRFEMTPTTLVSGGIEFLVVEASAHRYLNSRLTLSRFDQSTAGKLGLEIDAFADDLKIKGKLSSPLRLRRDPLQLGFGEIAGDFSFHNASWQVKDFTLKLAGSIDANLANPGIAGGLNGAFDGSPWTAKFQVPRFSPLALDANLDIDRLILDHYRLEKLPTEAAQEGVTGDQVQDDQRGDPRPFDFSFLNDLNLKLGLRVGNFQIGGFQLADLKLQILGGKGQLQVAPMTAKLFGGNLQGAMQLQANGNVLTLKQAITGIQVAALLKQLANTDLLEGAGNLSIDLVTHGNNLGEMKKQLAGSARLAISDGAIKGVDLVGIVDQAQALLGKNGSPVVDHSGDRTAFADLTASFKLANGIAHNDDLLANSPFLQVQGKGDIDVAHGQLDYLLKASAPHKAKKIGKHVKAIDRLKNAGVPIRLRGPLTKPAWSIDRGGVAETATAIAVDALKKEVGEPVGERITDTLKGLFGR